MSDIIQNPETKATAKKSIKSLKAHSKKESNQNDTLYLIVNTETPLLTKKDYTQRIIPIPHSFNQEFEQTRILIITKDNSTTNNYVELFKPLTSKYENVELMSIKKLRRINPKSQKRISMDYDYVICDYRIQKLLPDILGANFYVKNKKIPFIIQLSKETFNENHKKPLSFSTIKKDPVDLNYVMKQLKSIAFNTSFLLTIDSNITIKVGQTSQSIDELNENLIKILEFITDKSNSKITNLNHSKKHNNNSIKSILIKTTDSASLPIYKKPDTEE